MRYIRTKDNIIDLRRFGNIPCGVANYMGKVVYDFNAYGRFVVEQEADTIEELIIPGDLVRYDGLYMSWIEKDRGNQIRGIDMHLIDRKSICDLWIPVGHNPETYPDFKLVASKNNEKGELELI